MNDLARDERAAADAGAVAVAPRCTRLQSRWIGTLRGCGQRLRRLRSVTAMAPATTFSVAPSLPKTKGMWVPLRRPLLFGLTLLLLCAPLDVSAKSATAVGDAAVDWHELTLALLNFHRDPSQKTVAALHAILPREGHVRYDHSEDEKAAIEALEVSMPLLEKQIFRQERESVALAFDLFSITDGALSEDLDIMLGRLITINATLFLEELEPRLAKAHRLDALVGNLGGEYVDQEDPVLCAEINRRINALLAVREPGLVEARDACVAELQKRPPDCYKSSRAESSCPPPQEMGLDGFCFPHIELSLRLSEIFVFSDCRWISGMTCKITYNGKSRLPSEVFFTEFDSYGEQLGRRTRLIYPNLAPGERGAATFLSRNTGNPARIVLDAAWDGPWKNPY